MTGRALVYLLLPLFLLSTSGCLPLFTQTDSSPSSTKIRKRDGLALDQLKPEDFQEEIKRLEKAYDSGGLSAPEKAENQHRLALLYLMPANPHRDLRKGAAALQNYLQQLPEGLAKTEGNLWLQLLRDKITLEKGYRELRERSDSETAALEKEKQHLSLRLKDLADDNAKLKQDLEKLKMIDLSVEKKRKSYR